MFGLKVFVPVMAITTWLVVPVKATTSYYSGASGETSFNAAVGSLTLLNPALTFSGDLESNGLLNAGGPPSIFSDSMISNTRRSRRVLPSPEAS
jgi:hypothetical protein